MKLHRTVALFSAIALCFTLTAYFRFPILSALSSIPAGSVHVETLDAFDSSKLQPIGFHHFPASHDQRVKLAFRFCANSTQGTPNIVQTADGDRGVRFELDGSKLSMVYPGRRGRVTGKLLSERIETGRWYDVTAEFQSGIFVRAKCSAGKAVSESRISPVDVDGVVVGRGYDEDRNFDGQIRDFSIRSAPRLGMATSEAILLVFKLGLIAFGGFAVWRMSTSKDTVAPAITAIEPPASGPIDPLLSLRSFALLQVLIGHLFMCVFVSYRFPGRLEEDPWLRLLAPAPWAGVWVFFTLSGYLMGKGFYSGRYSLEPQRVYRYLSNRALRIVPVYWSAVLAVSVFTCPEIFQLKHISLLGSILIFDYNGQERMNPIGALWSVSTEVQFYALVPILFWGLCRLVGDRHERAVKLSALILVVGLVARLLIKEVAQREGVNRYIYSPVLANLDLFVLGMLANPVIVAIRSKKWVNRFATVPWALALIGGGYLISAYFGARVITRDTDLQRLMIYGPTFVAPFTVLVIACCELGSASQAKSGFVRRALIFGNALGILAYPIYVWHEPILLGLRTMAPTPLTMGDAIKYSVIATFFTWTVAEFIYRTIELPTEKLKKKKLTTSLGDATNPEQPATVIRLPEVAQQSVSKAA